MRILAVTETCDLGSLYLRLIANGHEVRMSVSEPLAAGTMAGMVPRTADWRGELPWVREAGRHGVILFEAVGFGELQDELRRQGFNVIGGSGLGDRLENDRAFAQQTLAGLGFRTAPIREFSSVDQALDDIEARPRRCVFKRSASAGDTFVGMLSDGSDIAAFLESSAGHGSEGFVLMDHMEGVETGIGAYFNGDRFIRPACLDWEHKRFFPGDLGELTGEMGTVATFDGSDALFAETLGRLEPLLREGGHVGYINLNLIINAEGLWPLEFTCRFGYPGFAVLEPLQALDWGDLFEQMIGRSEARMPTCPGFALCVVLTTPPFPYSRKEVDAPVGLPVVASEVNPQHLHFGEVGMAGARLVTSGLYGWTAVVTGTGRTIERAKAMAYCRAGKVQTVNLRYRPDIGDKLIAGDFERLVELGWLKSIPPSRMASQIVR